MNHTLFQESPLSYWLSLFPAASREKPRFAALAEAVLRQAADLAACAQAVHAAWSVDGAAGQQLDALGELLFFPRAEGQSDAEYRAKLKKKLKLRTWDGTNETVPNYLEAGETLQDLANGSVKVTGEAEMMPIPMGVTPNL